MDGGFAAADVFPEGEGGGDGVEGGVVGRGDELEEGDEGRFAVGREGVADGMRGVGGDAGQEAVGGWVRGAD